MICVAAATLCAGCGQAGEVSGERVDLPEISGCKVTDGDTIRCGDERVRLLGIDAPEMPGHCRPGRNCAPGDPEQSTDNLRAAMKRGPLHIERHGKDHYGRTLAHLYVGGENLACLQLNSNNAIYRRDWDKPKLRLVGECGEESVR
ncbi:thermonuclease family protein [Altererythrobacter endophyticus]|uniref:Thermonuclease family protein n=2 Tax=Altericroceibacterium endophyticum TaxID=1808508 RepID=A0A6I4T6H1_9SPHN|nr:thermonuclease family protein [Altericroceibacterium endophyticum]